MYTNENELVFFHYNSVTGIVVELFIHLSNIFPVVIFQIATLRFHKIINHTPIGIGFHNELRERFESGLKHCVFVHKVMVGHRRGVWGGRCATFPTGFRRSALPVRSVENPQRNGAAVGTPNGGRSCLRYLRS